MPYDLDQSRAREVARMLALVEAEVRYYQDILANVPVGLAVLGSDLSFLSANRAFRVNFGLSNEPLSRLRITALFPGEDVAQRMKKVVESGAPDRNIPVSIRAGDGVRRLRLFIQPLSGWSDQTGAEILLLAYEVTGEVLPEQVAAPEPSPEPQQQTACPGAILWERDAQSQRLLSLKGATELVLGVDASHFMSSAEAYLNRVHPQDRRLVEQFYQRAAAAGAIETCDYRVTAAQGRTVWLRDLASRSTSAPDRVLGVTIDITDLRVSAEQQVVSEKMRAISRLATKVVQDCANVVTIVTGYAAEMREAIPPGHTAVTALEETLAAVQRLNWIATELQPFARTSALRPKVFDMTVILEGLQQKLRQQLGDNIHLDLSPGSGIRHISADPDAISNCILKLADHARAAMPEGGKFTISTSAADLDGTNGSTPRSLPPGRYVKIACTDTGIELDEVTRSQLFEPFFSATTPPRGMAAVYTVIRNSGGDIMVAPQCRGGNRFTILLPQIEVGTALAVSEPAPEQTPARELLKQRVETVLVVEDETSIRTLIRRVLQKEGYEVLEAGGGEEALRIAESHRGPIDLLITDATMPEMSGYEVGHRLRALRPEMRVLLVTSYPGEVLQDRMPPPGATFLQKPFSLAALVERTRRVLGERRSLQASAT